MMNIALKNAFKKPWIRNIGKVAFLIFLIKGILWLIVLAGTMWGLLG